MRDLKPGSPGAMTTRLGHFDYKFSSSTFQALNVTYNEMKQVIHTVFVLGGNIGLSERQGDIVEGWN